VARGGDELERAARFEGELHAEFARERADALGRAGRRLEEAIAEHREAVDAADGDLDPWVADLLLESIAERFHALVTQRECVGLRLDNVGWIRRHYDVPPGALYRR
jgi:uncharacterized membrane protein YqiK